jgi:hypothetical protein
MDFQRELDVALKVARAANALLSQYSTGAVKVSFKGVNDPVTEADTALNTLIFRTTPSSVKKPATARTDFVHGVCVVLIPSMALKNS